MGDRFLDFMGDRQIIFPFRDLFMAILGCLHQNATAEVIKAISLATVDITPFKLLIIINDPEKWSYTNFA